ncbi:MAG TPA: TetR/AcrR family transcriptional regulator [Frankiaceae bacterium]|nr:TetR/AcrR family transcriptional regulator [Frankiaceae bacterium]
MGEAVIASSTRDRLLDAAERCLRTTGIRRTTVGQIAEDAGVSRAWLYRLFPDKISLIGAALLRGDEEFWSEARAQVEAADGLAGQVAAAVAFSHAHQPRALVLRLKEDEPEAFAAVVGSGLRQILPGMSSFWHPYLEAARVRGEVRAGLDIARAAEWILRIVISLVTTPGDAVDIDDPAQVRAFLTDFLVAGLA